tara:strand:+ start:218 stop:412 length:195 start_codon:yes stop_codon:yes gene_type:complete
MDNMKKFHWNEDTLEFFKELKNKNENEFYRKVNEFVKYECDLEEGEYIEDLQTDLINQVIKYKL